MGFMLAGLLIQVVTYCMMPDAGWISLMCGCLGVCSVCLCAQGNILHYLFGFGQVVIYIYLSWQQRFYGEVAINVYYFVTMMYGVWVWKHRIHNDKQELIVTRTMSKWGLALIVTACAALSVMAGWGLANYTDDTQPYMDAFTTAPALIAQVLMILAYREQWYLWMAVDLVSVALWIRAVDYCMVAQYAFWCVNCIYGYVRWTQQLENDKRSK